MSITALAKNGVWEIVSEISNPKVRVIFVGNSDELKKSGDSEDPSGIFMDYLDSSITQGDGTDLRIIESKYKTSDLKQGTAKAASLDKSLKSAELVGLVSENYEDALLGLFNSHSYDDIKIYNKGNKTIVNYINLYIVFDKGDAGFRNASAWN